MYVPQVTIKQEKVDNFTVETDPNENYETPDVLQIKLEPVKLESCSDVSIPINLDQQLQFSEEIKMFENDNRLYQSQSQQKRSDIKPEGSEKMDIKMMDDSDDKKWEIKNEELNIKEDENVTDEEHRNSRKLVQHQQQKEDAIDNSENKSYKCEQSDCTNTYQEIFTEKTNKLKPGLCISETNHVTNIKCHPVYAHDKSKKTIIMYKCNKCDYQTFIRGKLINHLLKHKNSIEDNIYKCDQCDYQTGHNRIFQLHIFRHTNFDEVDNMYKCGECDYKTDHKGHFNQHTLKHKNSDEVHMYKCDQCDVQTKYKHNLNYHILKHKSVDEVKWYKCNQCNYQNAYKNKLKRHLLKHKKIVEIIN